MGSLYLEELKDLEEALLKSEKKKKCENMLVCVSSVEKRGRAEKNK